MEVEMRKMRLEATRTENGNTHLIREYYVIGLGTNHTRMEVVRFQRQIRVPG